MKPLMLSVCSTLVQFIWILFYFLSQTLQWVLFESLTKLEQVFLVKTLLSEKWKETLGLVLVMFEEEFDGSYCPMIREFSN